MPIVQERVMYQPVNKMLDVLDHEGVVDNPPDQEELVMLVDPFIRRFERVRKFAIPRDYVMYLGEADYDIGHTIDPVSYSKAISCKQFDEIKSMYSNEM